MADAHEFPLWLNNTCLGYIDVKKCRAKKAPFFFDLNHRPIYVDQFCSLTRLKRTTWRQSISVEKPDGEIVPALPLITQPNQTATSDTERQVRRRPTAYTRPAPEPAPEPARSTGVVEYFSGLFSIARPPSQEAREAAREAAAAYLAEVDARPAARPAARKKHLKTLADIADLPVSSTSDEEKVCVICYQDLMSGRRLAATECGHVFCTGCISMSLKHNDICPVCRTKEPSVTVLYI